VTSDVVYLDHAATTPMRADAVAAMLPLLTEQFGNPSGSHRLARRARLALDEARDVVAECLGVGPGEIVFTGCGTESDNAAITGAVAANGGVPICSSVEHHAVLHPVEHHGGLLVGVDEQGRIRLDLLERALETTIESGGQVAVVSVMAVNNETGVLQPLPEVARLTRRRAPGALVHTDAVQAPTWLDLRELAACTDLLSLSGHKFGGPKGVGVLRVAPGIRLEPLLRGGGQERDRRSGTHNVAGIVGLATALQLADRERVDTVARLTSLRDRLSDGLVALGAVETVPRSSRIPGAAHVCWRGLESEALLYLLDRAGICASAASACASGAMEPSHVLAAMGVERDLAQGAMRFSLGAATTATDVDRALEVLPGMIEQLRGPVRA
jgi:cysteine desulfurase